jgi:hypothetical protein
VRYSVGIAVFIGDGQPSTSMTFGNLFDLESQESLEGEIAVLGRLVCHMASIARR